MKPQDYMGRLGLPVVFVCLNLGATGLAIGQTFDAAAVRSQIAPYLAINQSLAREMTTGTTRLNRICNRTVTPVEAMPDLKALDAVESKTAAYQAAARKAYELIGSDIEGKLKAHNAATKKSGVCEKPEEATKDEKKNPTPFNASACDQANITKNNYSLLSTDIKILIKLLERQVEAIDSAITLEAKRCIRSGFSDKLANALQSPGPANHQSIARDLEKALGIMAPEK